jgi:aspartate-semialdehyde dehydrogenase
MAISIGRLRECPLLDFKFVTLSHNTVRGAAGGAILVAELAVERGWLGASPREQGTA